MNFQKNIYNNKINYFMIKFSLKNIKFIKNLINSKQIKQQK